MLETFVPYLASLVNIEPFEVPGSKQYVPGGYTLGSLPTVRGEWAWPAIYLNVDLTEVILLYRVAFFPRD